MEEDDEVDSNWCKVCCNFLKWHWKAVFTMVWPLLSLIVFLQGFDDRFRCMFILSLMAGYWLTECIPLYVTGLIPIFMVPMLNIAPTREICTTYMNATNALFIVGLMIAIAIEHSGLHLRVALTCMLVLGCSPRKLHFGLSLVTMTLSMWLLNAACCAMMCPIIMAILRELEVQGILYVYEPQEPGDTDPPKPSKITMGFFFSAPLAANIGGCGTLVGTGTNLAYKGLYEDKYPEAPKIDFVPWMCYNVPCVLLINFCSWLSLQVTCMGMFRPKSKEYQMCKRGSERKDIIRQMIKDRLKDLGPMNFREIVVATSFVIIILGWFFRSPQIFMGWGDLYGPSYVLDASFPFLLIIILFMIPASCTCVNFCTKDPSKRPTAISKAILSWDIFHRKFPWGMLFLIGGGFAIAYAGQVSGMSKYLGNGMAGFKIMHPFFVLAIVTGLGSIFTELTANTAICNIFIPILMDMSYAMDVHPLLYTFPTALVCSHAFMLPTGTPTNAIALGYAGIPTVELMKHAALTKLAAWLVTITMFPTYGTLFYDTRKTPWWLYPEGSRTTQASQP